MNKSSQAFTLVEMAMVIVIIAFLLGRFLIPLSTQIDQQRIQVTERRLQEIKEALIGYAVINRHLPCPASGLDGRAESYNLSLGADPTIPSVCNNTNETDGYLPWADLGVNQYDGWNRPFRYRVDGNFSDGLSYDLLNNNALKSVAIKYPPITNHFLRVQNLAGISLVDEKGAHYLSPPPIQFGSEVVAIVFSCGKNGKPDGILDPNKPGRYRSDFIFYGDYNKAEFFSNDADGLVNSDAQCTNVNPAADPTNFPPERKTNYIQDAYVEGSFDDILVWLPKNLVIQRMLDARVWSADLKGL